MDTDRLTSSTKDETVEAAVGHVLVDEHLLLILDAATHQADQVGVLQLGDQLDLVLELLQPLPGVRRQPLHRDLGAVRQLPLQQRKGNWHTKNRVDEGAQDASAVLAL